MTEPGTPPPDAGLDRKAMDLLNANVLRLAQRLESTNLTEFADLVQHPWKLMWTNFIGGLARGVGLFVGGGVMGAITLALLSWLIYHALAVFNMFPVLSQISHAVTDLLKQFLQQHPAKK